MDWIGASVAESELQEFNQISLQDDQNPIQKFPLKANEFQNYNPNFSFIIVFT
jgi:hypothetical protein